MASANGRLRRLASVTARRSGWTRKSGSRTRWGSCIQRLRRFSDSRSTRANTRSWAWRPTGRDGSFALNLEYFSFPYSTTRTFTPKFEALFGPPRRPETPFFTASMDYPAYYDTRPPDYAECARENQKYAD